MAKAISSRSLPCFCVVTLVVLFLLAAQPSFATTIDLGANVGNLNYTMTWTTRSCDSGDVTYDKYTFTNLTYVNSVAGVNQPLGLTFFTTDVPKTKIGVGGCPKDSYGPYTYSGKGYTIVLNPENTSLNPTITIPGYINPKYVVVGIVYAPPGGVVSGGVAKGNVSYTDSNLVSSTTSTKTSFMSGYTESEVGTSSIGCPITQLCAFFNGGGTGTSGSSYTQSTTTTDSTAVTIQKASGTTLSVNGPTCPYCGVDHDYDLIGVWVNAVELFTLTNGGVVQPNGYGYSTLDQPGLDIYWVYVGELNGDLPVRSTTTTEFARAWAASEVWPSGQGPGLTAQDEQNILQLDPYWDCTYESPWTDGETSPCAKPPDPTRFTESAGDLSFSYTQAEVGASPSDQGYTFSYTNTDTQGTDVTKTTSQTFSIEQVYSGSLFGLGLSMTLGHSSTITHTYETSSQFTSSNTSTAAATIWQVPCNVVGDACSPVYPPSNAYNPISCTAITNLGQAFGQGYTMYVYQDNLFGTFLMEPYGQ